MVDAWRFLTRGPNGKVYVHSIDLPARIVRLDLASGREEPFRDLVTADPTGIVDLFGAEKEAIAETRRIAASRLAEQEILAPVCARPRAVSASNQQRPGDAGGQARVSASCQSCSTGPNACTRSPRFEGASRSRRIAS